MKKLFRRWGVKDLLVLLSDDMKYIVIEERLMELLRKKWEDAKKDKIKVFANPQCWIKYLARRIVDSIQLYLITNMTINSCRARHSFKLHYAR